MNLKQNSVRFTVSPGNNGWHKLLSPRDEEEYSIHICRVQPLSYELNSKKCALL